MGLKEFPMWGRDLGNAIDCAGSAISDLGCVFQFPESVGVFDLSGHLVRIKDARESLVEALKSVDAAIAAIQ